MSANNNNKSSSSSRPSKKQKVAAPISPIPKENAPIYLEVPTSLLEKRKDCKKNCEWCACRKGSLDIRKRKTKVQVIRIVGWFGRGSVAQKQDGSKDANKSLRVNCLLKTLKGKVYYDTHNHWVTLDNHAEDRNFANYIAEFSAFAREKGFLDCLAFEDYESKEWTIHPLDLERKQTKATPEDFGLKKKNQVEVIDLEDLDLFTAEQAKEDDSQFIYNGESDSDSDPKMEDDQSEKEFDEKAFRAEFEKTEPIASSSDDESDEGKNCANTLGQFRQEAQTAFVFTQNPPQEEAEDAFDDKTTEITDPTELVEDSIVEKTTDPVDATLEKTVIVEHSVSDIHTELANVLASALDDKPEEKKKEEDDLDFLLDFDFRNPPQEAQKVTEVEEPIAQQAPVEDKPEETIPKEVQPEESKPEEQKPEESKPEEPTPMEVEPAKHTEPADDVQEAPAEVPTPMIEAPTVEAPVTETILVPAAPEQQKTPQKMTLRKRNQPEKKEEKKVVPRSSQRKNKAK